MDVSFNGNYVYDYLQDLNGQAYQGAGITSNNYNAIRVPLDLRTSYKWDNNITLFAAVDNVQNLPTDSVLRRAYRMGIRFSY
jgi:hypothetical protein